MPLVPMDGVSLITERARLVRLCYRITGSADAAEDLAQETLYEALRNAHKLHDSSGYSSWLSAIARNVCRRWSERRGRDSSRLISQTEGQELPEPEDDYDLEVELERSELVELLDRALGMLPQESREVLIERYVRDSPHAEIAERLGLSGVAVRKRLERGKLRLKRVLSTSLIEHSVSLGLADGVFADWSETGIWCPACGRRRLLGCFTPGRELWLICEPCVRRQLSPIFQGGSAELFRGTRGYRASYSKALDEHDRRYRGGVADLEETCHRCGGRMRYRFELHPLLHDRYAIAECERCGARSYGFVAGSLVLSSPEGRRFWREHPKIRSLPECEAAVGGVPAVVAGYESVIDNDRIEGVFVRDTFERMGIYRNGRPE